MKRCLVLWSIILLITAAWPATAQKKQGQQLIDSLTAQLAHQAEDTNKVQLLNDLSFACRNTDAAKGIEYGMQSLALANRLRWKKGTGWANNAIGLNYAAKSDYPHALEYLQAGLRIQEDLGDNAAVSTMSGNIGGIYFVQGENQKALSIYRKALPAARASGNPKKELSILGGIGNVYHQLGDYKASIRYLDSVVAIAAALKDYENVARNLGNVANEYSMLKDYRKSLERSFSALSIANQYGFKTIRAVTLGNIGETYLTMEKDTATGEQTLPQAIAYLKQGVEECSAVGYLAPMAEFSGQLSEAYVLSGNYKDALSMYRQSVRYNDSIFSIANKVKITNLETQREVELKNKQIEIDKMAVEKKRNERGFFTVGIGLLLAVILVIFRNYRVQRVLNGALSVEKEKVERRTEELDVTNKELNTTLTELKETQQQLIVAEKLKENEMIRSRISQDIHDDISSELTRISWVSELAKTKMKKADYGDMPGLLEKITDSSRETVAKLGEIIWTVNPRNDSLTALLSYMRGHITKFFADTPFQYTVTFPNEGTDVHINPELKRNLYLVMKEALNNVVKYSGAVKVEVSFSLTGSDYRFCIADNGRGIEEGIVKGGGNGLGNMRRRMESVQGACEISSSPGGGTRVCCSGVLH